MKSILKTYFFRKITILVFFGLGTLLGGVWFFFPLEISELSQRFDFWKAGIREIQVEDIHGYVADHCPQNSKQGCSCMVLLHGMADNALTWKKILLWPALGWSKMGLSTPLRIYALDLPGSGKSPPPSDSSLYRVRKQAEKLQSVLHTLCPQNPWIVAGNSLGGWVATWLTLNWPEGVSKLLLIGSAGLKASVESAQSSQLLKEPTVESLKEFQKRAYFRPRQIPERVWKEIVLRAKQSNASQVARAQTEEDFLDDRLQSLPIPTFLFWGREDQIVPMKIGLMMKDRIPGSIWREAPECGHLPQKECPLVLLKVIVDLINFGIM
jgi:pimeloyl-ACP methyl ester carboxylesterase